METMNKQNLRLYWHIPYIYTHTPGFEQKSCHRMISVQCVSHTKWF